MEHVFADALEYRAATLGIVSKDTIKVVHHGIIDETPQRSTLPAQTPQVFEIVLYRRAMKFAALHNLI